MHEGESPFPIDPEIRKLMRQDIKITTPKSVTLERLRHGYSISLELKGTLTFGAMVAALAAPSLVIGHVTGYELATALGLFVTAVGGVLIAVTDFGYY